MKNRVRSWTVLAVFLVVYSVISFALPFKRNVVFLISYIFAVGAISIQIYVLRVAFEKGTRVKSKFYGFPVAYVGVIYMLLQLVLGLVMMALAAKVPVWLPVVLYVVLLSVAVIGFIAADAMRDEVERQDTQLKKNISTIRALQSKVNGIVSLCNADMSTEVKKLAEELRYSDPVSNEAIREIEYELTACVDELQSVIADGDYVVAQELCRKARVTLMERNRLCKLNK